MSSTTSTTVGIVLASFLVQAYTSCALCNNAEATEHDIPEKASACPHIQHMQTDVHDGVQAMTGLQDSVGQPERQSNMEE